MNFLNLEYFLAVAEELNFTKAAGKMHISQQALSNHINKLEQYFGILLFERKPSLSLTPAGSNLVKNARSVVELKSQIEREIQDIKNFKRSELFIGISQARSAVYLPHLLPRFIRKFPQVKINLFESTSEAVEEALYNKKLDFSLALPPNDPLNIESIPLWEEFSVLVVPHVIINDYFPEKSEIFKRITTGVKPEMFVNCPFLVFNHSKNIGASFSSYCKRKGFKPKIILETTNINTLISLCLKGLGIIICPQLYLYLFRNIYGFIENVSIYRLTETKEKHMFSINYLKNRYINKAVLEFIRIAKEEDITLQNFLISFHSCPK